jgi:ketosteroid isomerase-like protein
MFVEVAHASNDVEKILSFWTDDAKVFPANAPVVQGKPAIRAYVTESLKIPGFRITWRPDAAVIGRSGDLGYTTGENSVSMQAANGTLATFPGRYVTIWRKEPDGRWKCVIDIWNSGS